MIEGQVLYSDLDPNFVCHKATTTPKSAKEQLSGLIAAEGKAVCAMRGLMMQVDSAICLI